MLWVVEQVSLMKGQSRARRVVTGETKGTDDFFIASMHDPGSFPLLAGSAGI